MTHEITLVRTLGLRFTPLCSCQWAADSRFESHSAAIDAWAEHLAA